jgi:hypothetical protein
LRKLSGVSAMVGPILRRKGRLSCQFFTEPLSNDRLIRDSNAPSIAPKGT